MRVLVTGGTGYVGSYTVAALVDAGHDVRLLIRSRDKVTRNIGPLGVDTSRLDIAEGDMTDETAVAAAVDGVDAVIHSAAVVAVLNRKDADGVLDLNVRGTQVVVNAALAAGVKRVVHVSSTAAVFDPKAPVLTTDLPPAVTADSPYTRSKALSDEWARHLQSEGKPITIVYPGGVGGPATGELIGELAEGVTSMLKTGCLVLNDGAIIIIDVRDLAQVMVAAAEEQDGGPHRYMAGGTFTPLAEVGEMLRRLTGRRFPVLPTPGVVFRSLGRAMDVVRHVVPIETVFTHEAMSLLTQQQPTDDSAVREVLGITYRDRDETMTDMVRGLYSVGRLSAKQVGSLAT